MLKSSFLMTVALLAFLVVDANAYDFIPKAVMEIKLGTSWKAMLLSHPGASPLSFDIDGPPAKLDPDKPQEAFCEQLVNPNGLITYFFYRGALQGVTFARTKEPDSPNFIATAKSLFGNSPQIKDDPQKPGEKIYTWRDSTRLIQLLVPAQAGRGVGLRILSPEFAKTKGYG
jgi:hypothetical protein